MRHFSGPRRRIEAVHGQIFRPGRCPRAEIFLNWTPCGPVTPGPKHSLRSPCNRAMQAIDLAIPSTRVRRMSTACRVNYGVASICLACDLLSFAACKFDYSSWPAVNVKHADVLQERIIAVDFSLWPAQHFQQPSRRCCQTSSEPESFF